MPYKCVLEPHHRIPPPILSILVGKLPKVSTTIEDVSEDTHADLTSKLDERDQGDAWDRDWGWSIDDEPKAKVIPPMTESYMVSASAGGRHMVLAHKTKFVVIELKEEEGEYCAVGQGSGCEAPGETITAILCLALFVPSIRKNQMFVMAGYSTGWLRVFSETGSMLTAQLLEPAAILSIKMRTPPPVFKVSPQLTLNEDEEITILFKGNRVVSIDGQSLWMVLRVCDGQRESGIDASRMQTAFTYKKYEFQQQEEVRDVVSLGPTPPQRHTQQHILFDQPVSISTKFSVKDATSRYIAGGSNPMFCYYATTESSRPLMSAVSMASYVMSRVATPVFSFAKSWWTGNSGSHPSSSGSTRSNSPAPYVPDMPPPPSTIEPATPIPSVLTLNDPNRRITHISVSPPSSSSQRHTLAASSDMLGRVILWDLQAGEMVRMWKGIREAVCGWVEIPMASHPQRVQLFLVIYSEKRGLLVVYHMRHGACVGTYRVGQGWRLVPCGREPLGSSMVSAERRKAAMRDDKGECGCLSKCLLIGPDGEVRNITIQTIP